MHGIPETERRKEGKKSEESEETPPNIDWVQHQHWDLRDGVYFLPKLDSSAHGLVRSLFPVPLSFGLFP